MSGLMVRGSASAHAVQSACAGVSVSACAEKHAGSHMLSEVHVSVLCDRVHVRVRMKGVGSSTTEA